VPWYHCTISSAESSTWRYSVSQSSSRAATGRARRNRTQRLRCASRPPDPCGGSSARTTQEPNEVVGRHVATRRKLRCEKSAWRDTVEEFWKELGVIARPLQRGVGKDDVVPARFRRCPGDDVAELPLGIRVVTGGRGDHIGRAVQANDRRFGPARGQDGRAVAGDRSRGRSRLPARPVGCATQDRDTAASARPRISDIVPRSTPTFSTLCHGLNSCPNRHGTSHLEKPY
jgi:hypothetical protein